MIRNFESFILEELKSYDSIDDIISRITKTGYISKSIEKQLIDLSSDPNIIYNVIKKVEQLKRFYRRAKPDMIEDIMFSMLDDTPYECTAKIGFYVPRQYRWWRFSSDDINTLRWLPENMNRIDAQRILLTLILKAIKEYNQESQNKSIKSKEEAKTKKAWTQNPRSRDYSPLDYFSQLSSIQPVIRLEFTHDEYPEFWEYEQYQLEEMVGFTSDEFYADYKTNSLASKIKNSTRLKRLGNFTISSPYSINTFTTGRFWVGDEHIVNPRPVLVRGYLDLNFNLPND